ncbi:hypothetical protein JTE90_008340 [Oedothorax gibbosus]|uniref:Aquaporin n=1 Tax=Oedothorax gibbosus TaxID=931172 RepID=A0AAV6U2F8_9ARAC|nr:hypothetical protein JTE90_008340 [Oedothorax gibbosus]
MSDIPIIDRSRRKMSFKQKLRNMLGHEEFKKANIYKALLAEFLGTGMLVLVGCGSTTLWDKKSAPSVVQIALAFGIIMATVVQSICHISGGHINPAISLGCLVAGHCSILRAVLYLIVQCLGAVAGAAILWSITPGDLDSKLGMTALGKNMNGLRALGVEIIITFILVVTVLSVIDHKRKDVNGSAPLAIGLSITACHLWAFKFTGASMNTARTFGPAVIMNNWEHHWVYWLGPLAGGFIAGLLYKWVFEAPKAEEDKLPPDPLREDSEEGSSEPPKRPPPRV